MKRVNRRAAVLVMAYIMAGEAAAQTAATIKNPTPDERALDDNAIYALMATGDRVETDRAVFWFDRGGSTVEERNSLAERVNKGIADLEQCLGIHFDPNRFPVPPTGVPAEFAQKIPYFVTDSAGISHLDHFGRPRLFLLLRRLRTNSIPYLHETAHLLLFQTGERHGHFEAWLAEGSASYIEDYVAEHMGGQPGRVFTKGGNIGVDAEALAYLKTENGRSVVSYIGAHGVPPTLQTDRANIAAPFYVLSQSFCKYLFENVGLSKMEKLNAMMWEEPGPTEAKVERLTGKAHDVWRSEWLASIGYSDVK
jgi:hypothetical protein